MKCLGVIPARFQSKRFPGKILAPIRGKPLLHWVFERAMQCPLLDAVLIATDDDRVLEFAEKWGAKAQKTSGDCRTGTDRVAAVIQGRDFQTVLNIQADYPDISPDCLSLVVNYLKDHPEVPMVTLKHSFANPENIQSAHHVKVFCDADGFAVKFTRDPLQNPALGSPDEHIGVYGFQREALVQFAQWDQGVLEKQENLEQLRALENGMPIKVLTAPRSCHGINVPEDIPIFLKSI